MKRGEKSKRRSKKELTKWIRKRIAANESIGRKDESRSWQRALAVLVRLHEDNVRLRGENERIRDRIAELEESIRHLLEDVAEAQLQSHFTNKARGWLSGFKQSLLKALKARE